MKLTGPVVVERAEQAYVYVPATVTMRSFPEMAPRLFEEVVTWARTRDLAQGAPFIRYVTIDMERHLDIEVGVPVPAETRAAGRVAAGVLPGGRYLTATHTGPYDRLEDATRQFLDFADERGLAFDTSLGAQGEEWAARLEEYASDPDEESDPEEWRTVLAFKLRD